MNQDHFLSFLVHHWHNLKQAQMYPSAFAYTHYWWYMEDGQLYSKQWYDWNGELYRGRKHNLRIEPSQIVIETYDKFLRVPDLVFTESETYPGYFGRTRGDAERHDGAKVQAKITLTASEFTTHDKGWDENGKLVWGAEKGPFEFEKCTESIPTSISSLTLD